ncbi:MAG: four-carbon acid sugar kinase family protein [Verrucomicrobiota bacterium]
MRPTPSIVVLADDLTGAAELAAIAHRHGLPTEVQTSFHPGTDAAVVCLDTDTRLLSPAKAAAVAGAVAREVVAAKPDWIFRKCDSVLRGSVAAEARATAQAAGRCRIVVLPANPSRGRIVRDGVYFIGDRPLHETDFARDPFHPRRSSRLGDLLGNPAPDMTAPDARTPADVLAQARALTPDTLPVGAADFFAALLDVRVPRRGRASSEDPAAGPVLLACGSALAWPGRVGAARGVPSFPLPHDCAAVINALKNHGRSMLGVGDGPETKDKVPEELSALMAESVARVLRATPLARLLIEGGATAAAVLHTLGWIRLAVTGASGDVALLRPVGTGQPQVCLKPGSYAWPDSLWP